MSNVDVKNLVDIKGTIQKSLDTQATKDSNQMSASDAAKVAPPVANDVEKEVVRQVQPIIDHLTNQEPWYQSRVTWGAILAGVAGLANLAGYSFSIEDQQYWVDTTMQAVTLITGIASLLGGAYAWYGRWRAQKPIGQ